VCNLRFTNSSPDATTLSHSIFDTMKEDYKAVKRGVNDACNEVEVSFKDVYEGHSTTKEKLIVAGVVAGAGVAAAAAADLVLGLGLINGTAAETATVMGVLTKGLSQSTIEELKRVEEGFANGRAYAISGKAFAEMMAQHNLK
jgi:hypothetical protein